MKTIGFAGCSGSGKTTLIEKLVPLLTQRGLKVSVIKHAHHRFDLDRPGKDSWRHRQAGAAEVLLASAHRWVLMHELRGAPEPELAEQLARLSPCDVVLVEGFRHAPIPKVEVWRAATGEALLHPGDPHYVALASDRPVQTKLPRFALDDAYPIADFIQAMDPALLEGGEMIDVRVRRRCR